MGKRGRPHEIGRVRQSGASSVNITLIGFKNTFIIVSTVHTIIAVTIITCAAVGTVAVSTGGIGVTSINMKTFIDINTGFTVTIKSIIASACV